MPTPQIPFDAEEFWDDLLAFIEEGRVIPVVGAELLTVETDGVASPLYRVVAERLLAKYKSPPTALRAHHELNDAVSILAASGKRLKDLYRPIHDILHQVVDNQPDPLPVLSDLGSIRSFDLFVTTTPDDLLARAINASRFGGSEQTDQIEYAPSLPTERRGDIPELPPAGYTAVFYMFGRADVSPLFAIHDEDALEFAYTLQYTLQNGVPPVRMFSEVRTRNLLFIGCNLADWFSRFFLRLSNEKRLSSEERPKKEFLVDRTIAADEDLTVFLERFSHDSRCYPIAALDFVSELCRRWRERNPGTSPSAATSAVTAAIRVAGAAGGSVFISYASEDVGAARKLFEAVQEVGADVAWLDKTALKPGDDWNQQILSAVRRCDFFVPVISSNTEHRTEGYFRLEWAEAAERSRRIQGRKFIFPAVIDSEFGGMDGYTLVPEVFRSFQFSHAPGGEMGRNLRAELTDQLRLMRGGKSK